MRDLQKGNADDTCVQVCYLFLSSPSQKSRRRWMNGQKLVSDASSTVSYVLDHTDYSAFPHSKVPPLQPSVSCLLAGASPSPSFNLCFSPVLGPPSLSGAGAGLFAFSSSVASESNACFFPATCADFASGELMVGTYVGPLKLGEKALVGYALVAGLWICSDVGENGEGGAAAEKGEVD
jgi:hypothetical protein